MSSESAPLGTGRTGGREATTGVIPGRYALAVGMPDTTPPKGWTWTALSSVAQLESGHTPSRKHPDYWDGNIPWIGIKDATANHGRTLLDTYQHVSALGLDNSSARLLPANTVCVSRTASVGFVVVMGKPMATSQDFVNWVCGRNLNPHFLKYVLLAEKEALWRFASGTTHQTIYYPEAKAFHICLPSITEQNAIAHILGSLDAKIELNRKMNETLETMARAFFKSWFIDFDPVRAKADGCKPDGMDEATARLFPHSFQESELGPIPKGWHVEPVGTAVRAVGGGTPSTSVAEYWEQGSHHWATPKDLSSLSSPILLNTERCLTDAGLAKVSSGLLPVGTVLLSSRAPVGYLAIAQVPVAVNQGFIAMVCDKTVSNLYALHWTSSNMDEIERRASGTTFQEISKQNFRPIPMMVPDELLMNRFTESVQPLYGRVTSNLRENLSLITLRDTLLPQLLSGELRIEDADRFVEAAL